MTTNGTGTNGDTPLATAIAILLQNQAAFVAQQAVLADQVAEGKQLHLEYERQRIEIDRRIEDRFQRIETQMAEVIRILTDHNRILAEHSHRIEQLTEAVRDRIGFKS